MATYRENSLDQQLDIAGSLNQTDTLPLADEPQKLGQAISSGVGAQITVGA